MTNEEWLIHAIEQLDGILFRGDLDLLNKEFQVIYGKCSGKHKSECMLPADDASKLEELFPPTIIVSYTINDPIELLGNLALQCIHAFFQIKNSGTKKFKILADKYYFEKPYKTYNPTPYLIDILNQVYDELVKKFDKFPGKAIIYPEKEKKEGQKNSYTLFCGECGYELKIAKKVLKKYNNALPTCPCGCKLAIDLSDETEESESEGK